MKIGYHVDQLRVADNVKVIEARQDVGLNLDMLALQMLGKSFALTFELCCLNSAYYELDRDVDCLRQELRTEPPTHFRRQTQGLVDARVAKWFKLEDTADQEQAGQGHG